MNPRVYTKEQLHSFLVESNKIEGITGGIENNVLEAIDGFLHLKNITVLDICGVVNLIQPDALFRNKKGLNVRVGSLVPLFGGPEIETNLTEIIELATVRKPFETHNEYETLHPFTDGNGRSGRFLWAWQMISRCIWPGLDLGFLHAFYYQSLDSNRNN